MRTQRKRAYLVLLGLGAAALLVDRLFLESRVSGPDLAAGRETARVERGSSAAPDQPEVRNIPELPFPAKLQKYSPAAPVADLFAAPAGHETEVAAQTDNGRGKKEAEAAAAQITQMLQGVFVQSNVQYAIVNGRALKRGENINGCTLTEISGTRVKFLCVDREVIATVPTSAGGPPH